MKIKLREITARQLVKDYEDNNEGGVVGYGGDLDIRPRYQREFIYRDKQRNAVIDTVTKGFPLNTMYWSEQPDDKFEIIDGQQRTISICQYITGVFSVNSLYFDNLPNDKKEQILNYPLSVYLCGGEDSEKLEWFKTINIAGAELTAQELRNAVYAGSWTADAKRYFSRNNCAAKAIGSPYLKGYVNRQEYLETAIKWFSGDDSIESYMSKHQDDDNAKQLWRYFESVISWIEKTFEKKRPQMKGVDWGTLYNTYKKKKLNPIKIEKEITKLLIDDDVTKKSGIYPYVLTRDEHHLSIRAFADGMKQKVYVKQKHFCKECNKKFAIEEMEADHIDPWHSGGKTNEENCQMLCKPCNRRKSNK